MLGVGQFERARKVMPWFMPVATAIGALGGKRALLEIPYRWRQFYESFFMDAAYFPIQQ